MSSYREQIQAIADFRSALPGLALTSWTDYANNSVALRKEDSIERGINRDGNENSKVDYSTKPVPTYLFGGKELNQGGRDYVKKNKTGTWYGLRQAEGLRSQKVNLTHTGDMWKGYAVQSVTVTSGIVRAQIGVTGNHETVFTHNVKRYGEFYRNTPTELVRLQENLERDFASWLNQYML